jgi:predicted permease
LGRFAHVQTRILILDSLLIAAIFAQWWFIGRRLDRLRLEKKGTTWIQLPAMVITSAGLLVALLSRGTRVLELIAIIVAFLAMLGWIVLIVVATFSFGKVAYKRLRPA